MPTPWPYPPYASVKDFRVFGVGPDKVNDVAALRLLKVVSRMIDAYTGQWFQSRNITLPVKSMNSPMVLLPLFLLSVETITINDTELEAENWTLYNGIPTDWENPRIFITYPSLAFHQDPWVMVSTPAPIQKDLFIFIKGLWGLVQDIDGTTPEEIKLFTMMAAQDLLPMMNIRQGQLDLVDRYIQSETTDKHQYTVANQYFNTLAKTALPQSVQLLLETWKAPYSFV